MANIPIRRQAVIFVTAVLLVVIQVGSYWRCAEDRIPALALRHTPEHTHFAPGTVFTWVWIREDRCHELNRRQREKLKAVLGRRYMVYVHESEIPAAAKTLLPEGRGTAYSGGFSFAFRVTSRGPFWVRVEHQDREGPLAASSGESLYIWLSGFWIRVHTGPLFVS